MSSFTHLVHCLAIVDGIHKLCFQFIDLDSWYVGTWTNTSRREVSFIMLWSLVITWPVGLYMEWELARTCAIRAYSTRTYYPESGA